MNFTIDTQNKKITLNQSLYFSEVEELKKFIGKGWEKWTLEQEVKYVGSDTGYVINSWRPFYQSPYWQVMYCDNNDAVFSINTTTCNSSDVPFTLTSLLSHGAKKGTAER